MTVEPRVGHGLHRPVRLRQVDLPAHPQPHARGRSPAPASRARSCSTTRTSTPTGVDPVAGAPARSAWSSSGPTRSRRCPSTTTSRPGLRLNGDEEEGRRSTTWSSSRCKRRQPLERGQGPARQARLRPVRRPAAAAVHRPGHRGRAAGAADGRAVLGARPDLDAGHRGPDPASSRTSYTIVIVTHNMQQAARVSDRTAFFNHRRRRQARPADRDRRHRGDLQPTRPRRPPRTTSPAASADPPHPRRVPQAVTIVCDVGRPDTPRPHRRVACPDVANDLSPSALGRTPRGQPKRKSETT